ncbi:virulence associated lipoprotein [Borreliella burgdorferi]|uniref:virulence associated lipoprotein n=1 Tax=Borreliella burgdorferi TaxID=139 RepID=UPI00016C55FC|nr:virulence associated lipoprotein [Borreliella burgdorferi]ACN92258.1 putative antigen, P35 [Borreliella burgdorferi 94a]
MKYYICVCFFLLLNACNSDFSTNQEDIKYPSDKEKSKSNMEASSKEEDPNKKIKNTLLNDLINLIEIANEHKEKYEKRMQEEPSDQYGILAFQELDLSVGKISEDTPQSKKFRKNTYSTLSAIDVNKLKDLSEIIRNSGQIQGLFNIFNRFGGIFDDSLNHVYSKKDILGGLEILDLDKLKNSFEKLLSIKETFSKMLNQLLLDYKNDKDHIRTETNKLKSHTTALFEQLDKKEDEAYEPKNQIFSISNL